VEPFSDTSGLDRGLPVDRVYIRTFVEAHAADVHGDVMEMSRSTYTDACGGSRVASLTIVDIDGTNEQATLVCDLCVTGALPSERFDCIVLTQTLQYLSDLPVAVTNLWSALRPGASLLITVPALGRDDPLGSDYWRFTPAGLRRRLSDLLPTEAEIEVVGYGNALAGAAIFLGLAVEDVGRRHLDVHDPSFPVIVGARVVKPVSAVAIP